MADRARRYDDQLDHSRQAQTDHRTDKPAIDAAADGTGNYGWPATYRGGCDKFNPLGGRNRGRRESGTPGRVEAPLPRTPGGQTRIRNGS